MSIEINIDYAADDSCQMRLWAHGHHEQADFLKACENELLRDRGRKESLQENTIRHDYWRTVEASAEEKAYGVYDYIHIESKPGRGAYKVTVMNEWLPLHQ